MATLLSLADKLKAKREGLAKQGNDRAIEVATAIVTDLIVSTPVDTSQALSNWQLFVGTKAGARLQAFFTGKHGSTQELSGASALAVAKLRLQSKKPGQPITISNLLPYIRRLNDGYSAQAPRGFVERAILIGRNVLKRK